MRVEYGEHLVLVGSDACVGHWAAEQGIKLQWTEGNVWQARLTLPAGAEFEYKYVVVRDDGSVREWQPGHNLKFSMLETDSGTVVVWDDWQTAQRTVTVEPDGVKAPHYINGGSAASRRDAEEAIAQADVGVFTYVEVLLGGRARSSRSRARNGVRVNGNGATVKGMNGNGVQLGRNGNGLPKEFVAEAHVRGTGVNGADAADGMDVLDRLRAAMRAASDRQEDPSR